jgi:hypothetical protein
VADRSSRRGSAARPTARSVPDQDGEGDTATDGAADVDGAADPDVAGDALGPADDDGAADDEAAGEALAGVLSEGFGVGVPVRRPPWPATNP